MLSNHYYPSSSSQNSTPTFVFLHGFLGDSREWEQIVAQLQGFNCLAIDLCRHGKNVYRECDGFDSACAMIRDTIINCVAPESPVVLVGYSLGARIAMHGVAHSKWEGVNLAGLVSEGGNFGLLDESARQVRLESDLMWAKRFSLDPIEQVLHEWYQQPIFSDLNYEQRQSLIDLRSDNLGVCVAEMLIATSLGKQSYLLDKLKNQSLPIHYICGATDAKFRKLAQESGLPYSQIANAGHNVHKEQPEAFVTVLRDFIARCDLA